MRGQGRKECIKVELREPEPKQRGIIGDLEPFNRVRLSLYVQGVALPWWQRWP